MRVEGLGEIGCIREGTIGRRSEGRGVCGQVWADQGCRGASRQVISKRANP